MTTAERNLAALRARFPTAARRVAAAAPAPPAGLSPEASAHVARRWLGERRWGDGVMLALSGWGDGAHVRALLAALPARAGVFVAESDPGVLRRALEAPDCAALLADGRLCLGTGEPDDAFFAPLDRVAILEVVDVEPLLFAPSYNRAPAWYDRFFIEFARQVDVRRKLHGTAVVDAELWQANTFENLAVLGPAPDVGALRNAFPGRPLVIVSAGPSLDESLAFVREAREVAVIAAVNSSFRAVRRAGVVPHFVLAADPREYTARGFQGVDVSGTWLVTTPIVDPRVGALFGGRVFTWSGANPLFTELRRRCGLPPGTSLVERGTVSACAVDLAALLGCDRVCLVGQDLAVREDGQSHAADSFYTDLDANRVTVAACRRLPGNTLPTVPVEEKLFVYLKTFEQLVAARPRLRFLNTARLGARLEGAPYASFPEALAWLGPEPLGDAGGRIASRHDEGRRSGFDLARARAALAPTGAYARDVLGRALEVARMTEALPGRVVSENFRDSFQVRSALAAAEALRARLCSQPRDHDLLEAGRTRLELHRCRETVARLAGGSEHGRRLREAQEHAWAIAEGAWFLSCCLRRLGVGETPGEPGGIGGKVVPPAVD